MAVFTCPECGLPGGSYCPEVEDTSGAALQEHYHPQCLAMKVRTEGVQEYQTFRTPYRYGFGAKRNRIVRTTNSSGPKSFRGPSGPKLSPGPKTPMHNLRLPLGYQFQPIQRTL